MKDLTFAWSRGVFTGSEKRFIYYPGNLFGGISMGT